MTHAELNALFADLCGTADRWVIIKRGLYYRPNGAGYTSHISEAWIVTETEADKHVYPYDEPVSKRRVPIIDYCGSADAVLPELNKYDWTAGNFRDGTVYVALTFTETSEVEAEAPTFAEAAVRALLSAKGVKL